MRVKSLVLAIGTLAIGGCADRLSEQQCLAGDWRSIGFEDGANGNGAEKRIDRARQCERFDVTVDEARYEAGRRAGLAVFCSPRGALDAALRGQGSINLCPADALLSREAYSVGRQYARAQSELRRTESNLRSARNAVQRLEYDVTQLIRQIRREENDDKRQALREDLRNRRFRLDRAFDDLRYRRYEIDRAERAFAVADRQLRQLRATIDRRAAEEVRAQALTSSVTSPTSSQSDGLPPIPSRAPRGDSESDVEFPALITDGDGE